MALLDNNALPLITWLPVGGKDVSVENDSGTPSLWQSVSGYEVEQLSVTSTNDARESAGRPVDNRKFMAQLKIDPTNSATIVSAPKINGGDDYYRPTLNEKETWFFHGFWKSSTSSTTVKADLWVGATDAGSTVSEIYTRSYTISTSWSEFLIVAEVTNHAGDQAWRIAPRITIDAGQNDKIVRVRGMSAGRCLNFSKNVVFSRDITRKATMATSMGGITQTDLWFVKPAISISSFDEDYDFWRNAHDFWRNAAAGARWGFANDRTDHSKNWEPQLVLNQNGGFSHIPVGAERYRIDVKGQEQLYPSTFQPMGIAV